MKEVSKTFRGIIDTKIIIILLLFIFYAILFSYYNFCLKNCFIVFFFQNKFLIPLFLFWNISCRRLFRKTKRTNWNGKLYFWNDKTTNTSKQKRNNEKKWENKSVWNDFYGSFRTVFLFFPFLSHILFPSFLLFSFLIKIFSLNFIFLHQSSIISFNIVKNAYFHLHWKVHHF